MVLRLMEDPHVEDADLVHEALEGNQLSFQLLVERYQWRLFALTRHYTRSAVEVEDIVQDTFLKAYARLESFQHQSSFYTWLYRIAMNLAIDLTRKRKRRKTSSFEEEVATRDGDGGISEVHHGDGPSRTLERKRLYKRIMDAVDTLPEDQKQAILLRELEGLSYREISEIMGIPEGTVMSRLFYARKKLQKLLADER